MKSCADFFARLGFSLCMVGFCIGMIVTDRAGGSQVFLPLLTAQIGMWAPTLKMKKQLGALLEKGMALINKKKKNGEKDEPDEEKGGDGGDSGGGGVNAETPDPAAGVEEIHVTVTDPNNAGAVA